MGKSTHFSGQPLYCQVIKLLDKSTILQFFKRPCVQFKTHLRLRSNVLAFQVKCTYVLDRTHLRFGAGVFLVCSSFEEIVWRGL